MNPRFALLIVLLYVSSFLAAQTEKSAPSSPALDLVKQGQKLNSEGKQDEALALYTKALQAEPGLYDAHLAAGMALDLKGDYAKAREHFDHAIKVAPADKQLQAIRTKAMSYVFEGNAAEAAKLEQQVFDANMAKQNFDGAAGVANELARIYLELGDTSNAERWYKTGYDTALRKTDLSDADKSLWAFRWEHAQARIAARRGQKDDAQKHVAAAKNALDKASNPDQARFFPYLTGYVAFYTGDNKAAIADLQNADQKDPFILSLLAQACEKSGDQAKAADYYKQVLANNGHGPTNAFARPLAKKKLKM